MCAWFTVGMLGLGGLWSGHRWLWGEYCVCGCGNEEQKGEYFMIRLVCLWCLGTGGVD